ncbi:E3 ubiquitin-protein ligase CIP8-like [Phalaenopsis equestris]|uniref:E3 ubiquitin-protein ligase CIP8-like n=1 Tax=Phalaenopsis equestris TaxID=78828 RepID=UPI0009E45DD1|nr:E3 ubiquitin-protein ligase CIP8-like [Phalaenopsis equestris]
MDCSGDALGRMQISSAIVKPDRSISRDQEFLLVPRLAETVCVTCCLNLLMQIADSRPCNSVWYDALVVRPSNRSSDCFEICADSFDRQSSLKPHLFLKWIHLNDPVEEFEWEDVSERIEVGSPDPNTEEGEDSERNVEWEVLLFSLNRTDDDSVFVEDREGFAYASEYELSFEQLGGHGGSEWMKGGRPAAKSVVENLPSVLLTVEDVAEKNTNCAVCKDEISLSEEVKRLPCLHHYHECCIVPWLIMRNTCPLCRHELPSTDTSDAAIVGEEE